MQLRHPPFDSKQKCEKCHKYFIWNPRKEMGKYMLSSETIIKHKLKLEPKDYFLCTECGKCWHFDSLMAGNFQEEYAKQFKNFLKCGKVFIFR